jgi:hypothetical protein
LFGCEVDNKTHTHSRIPDYLHDLNAMHEAEKVLTAKDINGWNAYTAQLAKITGGHPWRNSKVFILVHATAAQRSQAFLKTLGLWRDAASNLKTVVENTADTK